MIMSDYLSRWLADELNSKGWSQRELARRAKISSAQISRVLSGEEPGQLFYIAVGKALGYTPASLERLNADGTPPAAYQEMSFEDLHEVVKQLSPDQRAEVLRFAFYQLWKRQADSAAKPAPASGDAAATEPGPSLGGSG